MKNIEAFVTAKLSNVQFPERSTDIKDDVLQMGGDIIFDENSVPIFKHLSKFPFDRPNMNTVLALLAENHPA